MNADGPLAVMLYSHPYGLQNQCPTAGYTNTARKSEQNMYACSRMRPSTQPVKIVPAVVRNAQLIITNA